MNLFQIATRGIDLDSAPITPDDESPREGFRFEEPAQPQQRLRLPAELDEVFTLAAAEYEIDPDVLRGIAYAESRFNPDIISGKVKSKAGAIGLMQFMPETAKEFGIEPTDPAQAIIGGAAYLRKSLDKFGGDYERAVASYNWGPNRKAYDSEDWTSKAPAETQKYLRTVFSAAGRFKDGQAERGLPQGMAPSKAGAGRGSVSPGMLNTQETQVVAQPAVPVDTMEARLKKQGEFSPLEETGKGLQSGYTGLKQMWEANKVLKDSVLANSMAQRLSAFDRIDAGATDVPRAIGLAYQQADAAGRAKIRADVQGELAGRKDFIGASMETIRQYQAEQQRTKGRTTDLTDVGNLKDFGNWLAFNGASGVVSMAPLMVAAVATGPAAPFVTGALGYGMATGELAGDRINSAQGKLSPQRFSRNPDRYDDALRAENQNVTDYVANTAGSTVGAAIPFAALDVVAGPVGSLLKGAGKEIAQKGVKYAAKEIGKDTLEETATGGLQEVIKIATENALGEQDGILTGENLKRVINSAAAEGAGGMVGGAGRVSYQAVTRPAPTVESQPTTPQAPAVAPGAPVTPDATKTQAVDNISAAILEAEGGTTQAAPVQPGSQAADAGAAPVAQGATDTSGGLAPAGEAVAAGQPESAQSLSVPEKGFAVIPSVETGQSLAQRLTKPATPEQEQAHADTVVAEKAKSAPAYTPAIPQPGQAESIVGKAVESARKNADLADERMYSTDALQRIAAHPQANEELKAAATNEVQRRAGIEQVKQQQFEARRSGTLLSVPDAPPLRPLSVERGIDIAKASRERKLLPQEQGYMDALKSEIGDKAFDLVTRAGKAPFMTTMTERKFDLPRLLEQNQSALTQWDSAHNPQQQVKTAPQAAQTTAPKVTGIGAEMAALKARSQPAVKMDIAPAMQAVQAPVAAPVVSQQVTAEAPVAPVAKASAEKVVKGKKPKGSGDNFSAVGTTYQWEPTRITQRQKTSKGQPAVDKAGNPVMEDVYPATIDGKDVVLVGQAVDSYRKLAELDAGGVKHTPRSNADAAPSAVTGIPAYSGNKASFVQSAGHRLMNWLKGAKGDVLYDAFGGGGGYGLWVVNNAAKNVKHLVINEIDQLRSEKLQWTLEYNGKLAELYNSPTLKPIIQLMRGLEGGGSVVKAASENARAGEVIAKPKKEYEKTNLPIFQKLAELGKKLTQEDKIAVQAIIDRAYASRAKHEDVDTIIKKSVEDSVQYHAQAVAFAARGGKISFTVHDGTDTTKIPKGSIVIADPPYLYTTGYKDSGDQELSYIEGPEFFEKSKQMLLESERMGNTVIYHNSLAALAGMRSGEKFGARYASTDTVGVAEHLDDFLPFKRVSSAPVPDDFVGVKYGRFDEGAAGSRSGDAWVRSIGGRTARIGPIAGGGAGQSVAQGKDGLRDAKLQVQSDTADAGIKASRAASTGATTSTIRTAITKAYGNLLTRLEGKGLVSLTQTEEEAIAAAAQARADQNGGDVEAIKASLRKSILASQRAWHGTPHRGIEKFSTDKIGTGEGAQAFGWGLYFADSRSIGEFYRQKLTGHTKDLVAFNGKQFHGNSKREMMDFAIEVQQVAGLSEKARDTLAVLAMKHRGDMFAVSDDLGIRMFDDSPDAAIVEVYDWINSVDQLNPPAGGQLYEVDIPNDSDMLLWDKPLSQQTDAVQNALDSAIRAPYASGKSLSAANIQRIESQWATLTGEKLYKMLEDANLAGGSGTGAASARAASQHLSAFGLKGIKYLDGTSRNAGEGSYNYVVFSGDDVQIVDVKYSKDGNLEGFFDPATGKSFLIADNLTAESAPGTLMHEVGIHMAADGKLEPLFIRAGNLLKLARNNSFIQRVQARMDQAGETSNEEAAAYIVTEYENDRVAAPESVVKLVKDFIADVRAWLFSKGVIIKADQLTVADIAAVARANANRIAQSNGWVGSAQKEGAFRFGNTEGQRSEDVATVAEAFSGEGIQLEGFSNFDGAQTGVRLKDAPTYTMEFKVQPGDGPLIVDATRANGETGQSPGGNAGQRMYQALFAWAHNNGKRVDADYSLSYVNELRRTSAMLSSALRFGTIDHFGELNEQQGVDGWDAADFDASVKALANAELRKVEQRVPVFSSLEIDPATGDVYSRVGSVLESEGQGLGYGAPLDGRLGTDQQGAGSNRNLADLERRLAARQKNTRRSDGREQDAVGAQTRNTDTVGNGTSVQGNRLSDSELARYLASTRGGFESHGVGVSTLKRALITRDHGGAADLPGLLYSVDGKQAIYEWADRETAPVGAWVKADYKLADSQPVYQVREMAIDDLYLPELTEKGALQPEKRGYVDGYAERLKAGEKAPSISVIEMENGRMRVVDGHRRVMAAKAAGQSTIRALVSPMVDTPDGRVEATAENIRRSVRSGGQQQAPAVTTWDDLGDSRIDKLIYEGQDDRIDLKRVQENIVKAGRKIREEFDARMAETLFPGRVAKRNESFVDQEVKPLLQAMAASNVSMEEFGDYLLARHAPERNAQIAKVNPDMPDGGAGTNSQGVLMTTQAANDYIANLSPGKRTALQLLAKRVDTITKGTRDLLITEGLEKASTVAAWEGAYKNYVPLFKDEAAETPGHPVGSGFSVKGGASKRAMGSTKEVTNVLAHVLMQREAAITRAEKNRVGMSLYGLALSNPNKEFWGTVVPKMSTPEIIAELQSMGVNVADAFAGMEATPTIRYVDPSTGLVTERPNPVYKNLDNALVVKVNGEDRVILFNKQNARAMRLAESLKNQNRGSGVFVDGANLVAPVTRFMASMLTQYNPAFGMVNAVRDIQGALVNLSSTDLKGQQAKVLAGVPAAMKGIARDLRGDKARTQWSDLWLQFQDDGGRTGIRDLVSDPYEKAGQIEKDLKRLESAGKLTPGNAAHAVLDLLSDFNDTLENGVRLSAYKTALDQGMSRPAAAKLARELTVDFNRKGRTGRELGKLYAFLNASIQGSARTIQSLKGPMGAKIMAGGFALGVLQAFMLAWAGFDDEDIPEFIKSRNLIIPMGGDRYVTIPMALGLHVLPNAGRVVTELVMSGGKDLGDKSLSAITEIVTSFNPFGGGGDWKSAHGPLTMVTPTVMDPVIDMAMNRDFAGRTISKERRNPGDVRPGATMAREGTKKSPSGQVYIGVSELINTVTGGTDVTKGAWSPTPEELRYMATVVGGGVYRETERAINAAVLLARGDEVKPHQVPLGSRFAGTVDAEMSTMGRYYKNDEALNKFWSEFKAEAKDGNTERVAEMRKDPRYTAAAMNSKIEQHISKLNKLAGENVGDQAKYEELNQKRAELMRKVNDAVKEAEAK